MSQNADGEIGGPVNPPPLRGGNGSGVDPSAINTNNEKDLPSDKSSNSNERQREALDHATRNWERSEHMQERSGAITKFDPLRQKKPDTAGSTHREKDSDLGMLNAAGLDHLIPLNNAIMQDQIADATTLRTNGAEGATLRAYHPLVSNVGTGGKFARKVLDEALEHLLRDTFNDEVLLYFGVKDTPLEQPVRKVLEAADTIPEVQ